MNVAEHKAKLAEHQAMLSALETGTATPDQQRAAFVHLQVIKRQHAEDMRQAERDARDSFSEGRFEGREEVRNQYF